MPNTGKPMRSTITIVVIVLLLLYIAHGANPAFSGQVGQAGFGIVMCLPIIGFGVLFFKFARWHKGFHRRMRGGR